MAKKRNIRVFKSGASRDTDEGKYDYEGFLSPRVIEAMGAYMNHHRLLSDGSLRASDNWQNGMPLDVSMKSGWRHFMEWWKYHRGLSIKEGLVWAICGLLFNANAYLHEHLKALDEEEGEGVGIAQAVYFAEQRREQVRRRRR